MAISPEALADLTAKGASRGVDLAPGLAAVERALHATARDDRPFVEETARYLVDAGGKRFRPMLVLSTGLLCGLDVEHPDLVRAGAIVELVHISTLYHDDVMDGADRRRGTEAAHRRWSNTVAVLSGDFLLARASELSAALGVEVTRLMARTIAELCAGQIREVQGSGGARSHGAARVRQTREHYLHVIAEKTASLISASTRLGPLLAGSPPADVEALTTYGHRLGMAFQLADDVLDLAAGAGESGKVPGTDLREGVRTLPVLIALASEGPGSELEELLEECVGSADDAPVERALKLLREHEALGLARDAARLEASHAIAALDGVAVPEGREPVAEGLRELARYATDRLG